MIQRSASAEAALDLEHGGRLASLRVFGHELLVTSAEESINWGWYPMAPWAGRLRYGRFVFQGRHYQVPINLPPHAIHGTVFGLRWTRGDDDWLESVLGEAWPFSGVARQRVELTDDGLQMSLEVRGGPMPAVAGWHPWFLRRVGGADVHLSFDAAFMLRRDAEGIATSERVPPGDGPWDDCFGGVNGPVRLEWPGVLVLEVETSCDYVVIFDQRHHAICVEPQTAPPDALNSDCQLVEPGRPLIASATWRWREP